MAHVFLDFETRSLADIREVGAWKYAAHYSTYPLMLAALWDSGRRLQWLEYKHGRIPPEWVFEITEDDLEVHAHNANFEIAIWRRVLVDRWGWPDIPTHRWVCTMGKCSHGNQPKGLAYASAALGGRQKKDAKGKELIQMLSIPRKAVKAKKTKEGLPRLDNVDYLRSKGVKMFPYGSGGDEPTHYWESDPHLLAAFAKYNEQDVVAEAEVDSLVRPYSWREQDVWALDSVINERGIPIDRELCAAAMRLFEHEKMRAEVGIQNLTDGAITGPKQYQRISKWINERDPNFGKSCTQERIDSWLDTADLTTKKNQEIKDLLDLKEILGGAAILKYRAADRQADDDDRARGQLFYHKASTGRWAGNGIQVHNFARYGIPEESVFSLVKSGDIAAVRNYCDEKDIQTVTELLKRCVRGLIKAPPGHDLVVSDFAGIESRVLQWLAGAEDVLDVLRSGRDLYVHTAAGIFGLQYDDMMGTDGVKPEHKDHRQIGKIAVLALGYGMGAGTYRSNCMKWGVDVPEDLAGKIVTGWRDSNPKVVELWKRLDRATRAVVRNPKIVANVANGQGITLRVGCDSKRDNLWIELPSTRRLYYPQPHMSYGAMNDASRGIKYCFRDKKDRAVTWDHVRLVYRDGNKGYTDTYGGKLTENVIQAISRDLLVESMFLAESKGLKIIFHVHDEIVVESIEGDQTTYDTLHDSMTTVPPWAAGLPLEAETYRNRRYTK